MRGIGQKTEQPRPPAPKSRRAKRQCDWMGAGVQSGKQGTWKVVWEPWLRTQISSAASPSPVGLSKLMPCGGLPGLSFSPRPLLPPTGPSQGGLDVSENTQGGVSRAVWTEGLWPADLSSCPSCAYGEGVKCSPGALRKTVCSPSLGDTTQNLVRQVVNILLTFR